ncbi:Eukaryotic translation initiation factor 3 subunit H [Wickerhamiella sorbophila]|uniref:Eukaryotic translation initiation factor 3 subunit H n=1 Tax=Wickerhamiella sorbophila TaxID=45607 RepID=A0A2T0FJ14_9ASCO|nr:Eukaryotic translation initiation factor 3 subunit H [Wickerhamiella sorbophila]PRT54992.1 Eukaryotic translation initiation factor 3 subunit H [Wickerhamiella sorbophila]
MPAYPEFGTADQVELDAAAIFQITRHLHDQFPRSAGGILLGMELEGTIEVTETFPLPPSASEGDGSNLRSKAILEYQSQMIEQLKQVGSDTQIQGWYVSSSLGAIYEQSFLDNMFFYQQQNRDAVMIVHDVAMSRETSTLVLKAFRLSQQYLSARRENKFTTESLETNNLDFHDLLEELPIRVHNSCLTNLLSTQNSQQVPTLKQLEVPNRTLVENNIEDILDSIDDFNYDQNNYNYYQRQLIREKQKVHAWQQRRRAENAALEAAGKPTQSVEEWKVLFKLPEEPSRLDNLLISAQLHEYCEQIEELAAVASTNLVAPKF